MKKFIIIILLCVFILNFLVIANAHSVDLDFYQMFEEHGSIMMLIDATTGEIEHVNQAAADFYGYSIEELESMNIQQIHTITLEEAESRRQDTVANWENSYVIEHRLANGELRTVEVYSCLHTYGEKTILYATIYDITEKVLLEQKSEKTTLIVFIIMFCGLFIFGLLSLSLYRNYKKTKIKNHEIENLYELRKTFINANDSLIYLKDENLKYIFVNKAIEKFFNRDSSEFIGKDVSQIADKEFADISRETDIEAIEKKANIIKEVKWGDMVMQKTKFPVKLINGNYGVGAYIRDITEEYNVKKNLEWAVKAHLESEEKLRIILDSTAEGIYGIDLNGNCIFCNKSCLKMLGYSNQDELVGKNMHSHIHHSRRDGSRYELDECRIYKAFIKGEGEHVDDEVFWRADGTFFDVEYYSYPQFRDGKIIGAVVTFIDITHRKKDVEQIKYLSCHDSLTGLYNKRYFEESLKTMDIEDNLPISIIFADVNGLKMTNDIFGHSNGDELIKKSAEVLKNACRRNDIIARIGGDEFIILLPNAGANDVEKVMARVKNEFSKASITSIKCSISLGADTKTSVLQDLREIITNAENAMYKDKTMERKNNKSDTISTIISTLHEKSPKEKQHSNSVSELCKKLGIALNLHETEIKKLEQAGFLHDIGKIVLDESILNEDNLSEEDLEEMKLHSVVGYRILNLFDDTLDLAEGVYAHHERWDGTGYPKGLKGKEIPMMARIISIAEVFDKMTSKYKNNILSKEEAIQEIKELAGISFDPYIVEVFVKILEQEENTKG